MPRSKMKIEYDKYMKSDAWQKKRRSYWLSPNTPDNCAGCDSPGPGLHLHHRTYARLGHELLTDLVALCKECHGAVHENFNMVTGDLAVRTDEVIALLRRQNKLPAKRMHWHRGKKATPVKRQPAKAKLTSQEKKRQQKARDAFFKEKEKQRSNGRKPPGRRDTNKSAFDLIRERQAAMSPEAIRRMNGLS